MTWNLAETSLVKSQLLVPHGAIFIFYTLFKNMNTWYV